MSIDHNYARGKLKLLLRDLSNYNAGEFWREMSRIASGATSSIHAERLKAERDALADSNTQLMQQNEAQIRMNAKLMHERAALAAALEDHATLIRDLQQHHLADKKGRRESCRMVKRLFGISHVSTTASLARRDQIQRAEELEEFAAALPKFSAMGMEKALRLKARQLRRQAEQHDSLSPCPDCEGDGNIACVTCPICDGAGALTTEESAQLHTERLAEQIDNCELECGAYGTYCKCSAEGLQ